MSTSRIAATTREISRFRRVAEPLLVQVQPRRVGLALSGGADSVALAWLWHKTFGNKWPLHALIVDHKMRPESTQEASATAEYFERLTGRKAQVITSLRSQSSSKPMTEGQARELRYMRMAITCLETGIDCLLTGHHADDQAETVLVRALQGNFAGVHQGMYKLAPVPCCESLPSRLDLKMHCDPQEWQADPTSRTAFRHNHPMPPLPIQLMRPLLSYYKNELYQICKDQQLPWSEDSTNRNVTFTMRNAVRRVLNSDDLPRAFRTPRLLSLSHYSQAYQYQTRAGVERIYAAAQIRFDPRTGMLAINLPSHIFLSQPVARELIRQILQSIAPVSAIGMQYERQALVNVITKVQNANVQSITAQGWVRKVSRQSPVVNDVRMTADLVKSDDHLLRVEWKFRCLPPSENSPRSGTELQLAPLPAEDGDKSLGTKYWPRPRLWDHRFFLTVRVSDYDALSLGSSVLIVRPLSVRDLLDFLSKDALPESDAVKLKHEYKRLAKLNAGYFPAIPALCIVSRSQPINSNPEQRPKRRSLRVIEDIVAIPALNYIKSREWKERVHFELTHKSLFHFTSTFDILAPESLH